MAWANSFARVISSQTSREGSGRANLITFFNTYPYLGGCLVILLLALAALAVSGAHRRPMLLSGLLSAPYGFASIAFVPDYWQPVRIAEFGAGPEDLVFSFSNGCLVWFCAVRFTRSRFSMRLHPIRLIARFLACTLAGIAVAVPLWLVGCKPMIAVLCAMPLLGVALLLMRRSYVSIALAGAVGFTALYTVVFVGILQLWPRFIDQWTTEQLCGLSLLGVPVEEIAWSLGFGAVWPLMMAYAFDLDAPSARSPLR